MDEVVDGGVVALEFVVLHEFVVEVGVEFLSDPEGEFQEWVVLFLGDSPDGDSQGAMVSVVPASLLGQGHYGVGGGGPHLLGSLEFVAFGEVVVGLVEEFMGGLDVFGGYHVGLRSDYGCGLLVLRE